MGTLERILLRYFITKRIEHFSVKILPIIVDLKQKQTKIY